MDFNCHDMIISEDYADFIIEHLKFPYDLSAIPNTCYNAINERHTVVFQLLSDLEKNIIQKYGYSIYPNLFSLMDIQSLEVSGVSKIRNLPALNLYGDGVLIGIVDTGIDYRHKAFKNEDGTTRIISIWDQTIQTGPYPATYYYGTEYTREQINEALKDENSLDIVPTIDELGHGTAMAGIAAGTPDLGADFSGIATRAEFVIVKLKQAKKYLREFFRVPEDAIAYQENDILFGVRYLFNIAKTLNRPIAICIGIGTSQGSHDGRDALSQYLSLLGEQNAVAIAIAAGNEGNTGRHYRGDVPRGLNNSVELVVSAGEPSFAMELWGKSPGTFSIDIMSPTGEYIPRIPARLGESREIRFIFEKTVISIDYLLVETQSGDQLIFLRFVKATQGIWKFRVYSKGDIVSHFDIWLPIKNFLGDDTHFVNPDPNYTLTSPGNAALPIVVTAYNHVNSSLYLNASKGFNRIESIVPSFAAPGVNLVAPDLNGGYTPISGTSMATAHTAGIAALLLQWSVKLGRYYPLDTTEIKNYLIRGAKRDPNNTYPNKDWGYGILDLYTTFIRLREGE